MLIPFAGQKGRWENWLPFTAYPFPAYRLPAGDRIAS